MKGLVVLAALSLAGAGFGQFETGWQYAGISGRILTPTDLATYVVGNDQISNFSYGLSFSFTLPLTIRAVDVAGYSSGSGSSVVVAGTTLSAPYAAKVQLLSGGSNATWTFSHDTPNYDEVSAVAVEYDAVYAALTTDIPGGTGTKRGMLIVRLDKATGAVKWSKSLDVHPLVANGRAVDVVVRGQNAFVLGTGDIGQESRSVLYRLNASSGSVSAVARPAASYRANRFVVDSQSQIYLASANGLCRIDGLASGSTMPVLWTTLNGGAYPCLIGDDVVSTDFANIYRTTPLGVSTQIFGGLPPEHRIGAMYSDNRGQLFVHRTYVDGELGFFSYVLTAMDPLTGEEKASYGGSYETLVGAATNEHGTTFISTIGPNGPIVKQIYQRPEPVADYFYVDANDGFLAEGWGVLGNDAYTDPRIYQASLVSGPSHGRLDFRREGGFYYSPDHDYVGTDTFRYRVTHGSLSGEADVIITVGRTVGLSLSKSVVAGQNTVFGTVILPRPLDNPAEVLLGASSTSVTLPAAIGVPARKLTRDFTIYVKPVLADTVVEITASRQSYAFTQSLTLKPLVPTSMVFTPSRVSGGSTVDARIIVNGVAGPGGLSLDLSSTSPNAHVPSVVTVPPGGSSVSFTFGTTPPSVSTLVTITASVQSGQKTAYLRIDP